MQKINRLVWAEGACFESYGVRIGIRTSQAGAIERLTPFLPPQWKTIDAPRKLDTLYSWVVGGEPRPNVRTFDVLYEGSGRIARTLKPDELFETFETRLRMTVALLSRRFVFIHAAAVGWCGRAVIMPGRSFTGKSTLVEALVRAGADYFSDEYAVLDKEGRVHPFAKPISVRVPVTLKQQPLIVKDIGGSTCQRHMKLGAILVTRYRKSVKPRFRIASPGQGMLDLLANAVAIRSAPSRVLGAIRRATAGAIVLRGSRGEASEATRCLLAILDQHEAI